MDYIAVPDLSQHPVETELQECDAWNSSGHVGKIRGVMPGHGQWDHSGRDYPTSGSSQGLTKATPHQIELGVRGQVIQTGPAWMIPGACVMYPPPPQLVSMPRVQTGGDIIPPLPHINEPSWTTSGPGIGIGTSPQPPPASPPRNRMTGQVQEEVRDCLKAPDQS
jgi:hypothetical protein